ncbi:hypothetical protein COMA1_10515 [Candidatus Nitrospira nitrosa]|uniref:Uncharacterized protein n=1 Tax=Candidatus Nitrospira nitrosa TaxID=1742972 RepID=A0A0S4L3G9_9BACT|nr:hypothetical protein COMA1_10515 [Candidatus Nitrospira nitrosa]
MLPQAYEPLAWQMGLSTVKAKSCPCRELLQERIFTMGQAEAIKWALHG